MPAAGPRCDSGSHADGAGGCVHMIAESKVHHRHAARSSISEYFDEVYGAAEPRYWWRHDDPYTTDPEAVRFSLLTQMTLRLLKGRSPGRALDLGAGEGADSIRLARLGYQVTAVEISGVGAKKIVGFANDAGVAVDVDVADVNDYEPRGKFDVIICNGMLHYVANKPHVIRKMQAATSIDGLNVISLWSTYSAVPECHARVPVFCDDEDGIVAELYRPWLTELFYYEREKPDHGHVEMPAHSHSHIKMIARKPE